MKRLIIADIHANLPALEAVIKAAGPVDQILFLGDIIDYGPNPVECVDLLIKLNAEGVIGNHDLGVLTQQQDQEQKTDSFVWGAWTFSQLSTKHLEYLNSLPVSMTVDVAGIVAKAVHAVSYKKYLSPSMEDCELSTYLEGHHEKIILCGHSHKLIDRQINNQRLISIYSVGQPKDSNNQAGYTIEEDGIFEHKRVEYNLQAMLEDVKKIGMPSSFEERWLNFMKKGEDSEWSNPLLK
jgi:predicted phosphodiesterase